MKLPLHRSSARRYQVGDTSFYLRMSQGSWRIILFGSEARAWAQVHAPGLAALRFRRRCEAVDYLQALFSLSQPPEVQVIARRELVTQPDGSLLYRGPRGYFRARYAISGAWMVTVPGGSSWEVRSIREVRTLISTWN